MANDMNATVRVTNDARHDRSEKMVGETGVMGALVQIS
jgi:hypothetical protein